MWDISVMCTKFHSENLKGTDLRGTEWKSWDWMHMHQDWDQWQVLTNLVMNFGFPYRQLTFCVAQQTTYYHLQTNYALHSWLHSREFPHEKSP